jgi:GWxTD domain-containing protein
MPLFTAAILTVTVVSAVAALQSGTKTAARVDKARADVSSVVAPPAIVPIAKTADKVVLLAQAQTQTAPLGLQSNNSQPDKVLYDQAIFYVRKGAYPAARAALNRLINTYPESDYLLKAKLAIADSWRQEADAHGIAQAAVEYKDFIQFYPNTPEAQQAEISLDAIDPYHKWVKQDVVYIISNEERKAFNVLTNDEEREKFVEQFWARRDPTPGTEANEFKQEHYRRIAYTNEHFTASIPGWKTDRGRIYIQYGPPDEIEAHSTGGSYERPAAQGGGVTQTFPFEQWRYRYIDGVGQNIIIEFVDTARNGEYRMTMDPSEKDILLAPRPADRTR